MKRYLILLILCISTLCRGQNWAVSTNLAGYAALGTMNLDVSYALRQHWSIEAGARYNPFTFKGKEENQFQMRQKTFALGARWWPWHIYSGWWISPKVQYMEFSEGGILSKETREGDRIGAGAGAGYTHMINSHLNIEFGASFWGGYEDSALYSCPHCGILKETAKKSFILPNEIIISLCYVF